MIEGLLLSITVGILSYSIFLLQIFLFIYSKTTIMQQYHIHHATGPDRFQEVEVQPRQYAGFVEADSIEQAYVRSQNGENHWNPINPCRSTSVGDIIQDDAGFHMVLGIGFKQLL